METSQAKLSPPEEHETEPALDVRLRIFADAEDWQQVRAGLSFCFNALKVFLAGIFCAFAAAFFIDEVALQPAWRPYSGIVFWIVLLSGTAIGCILCFIGGLKCRHVPEGNRGGGLMVLCLCAHVTWVLLVVGNAAFQSYLDLKAGHPVRLHTFNRIDHRFEYAAIAILAFFAMSGTMLWLSYLAAIAESLARPDLRASCKLCRMMSPFVAALIFIPNDFGSLKAFLFLTAFPFMFFWLLVLSAKCATAMRVLNSPSNSDAANLQSWGE